MTMSECEIYSSSFQFPCAACAYGSAGARQLQYARYRVYRDKRVITNNFFFAGRVFYGQAGDKSEFPLISLD